MGNKLDSDAVHRIQKGVTTRAQVEAMLGPPGMMSLLPDGRRQGMYIFSQTKGDALFYTPYVNYFAGGTINRKQTLQVVYKDDVVQDYEFSDTTEHTSGGLFNAHGQAVPTPADK